MTTMADEIRILDDSGLFDETWYARRYPDVTRSALAPIEHFVRIGMQLGRMPREGLDGMEAMRVAGLRRATSVPQARITEELRARIMGTRLFDADWYRATVAPGLSPDADPLTDYLERSSLDRSIDPGPMFSTAGYARANPLKDEMPPLIHACLHGIEEGRSVFDPHKVDDFLASANQTIDRNFAAVLDRDRPVAITYWSTGNFFFTEIAQYLAVVLGRAGYDTACRADLPQSAVHDGQVVIVAPHEFCVHGIGNTWESHLLRDATYLNTEQWHTTWFTLAYKHILLSNKVIDINPASAAGLKRLGADTVFLPMVPLEGTPFDVPDTPISSAFGRSRFVLPLGYPDALTDRPYDVLFVGAANPRRESALAQLAPVLADHTAFVHCPRFNGPVGPDDPDIMRTSDVAQIARNAKILLNIHQGESRYFEWHRLFLFGLMEGCVVLTEPSLPNAFVEAGTHFLECEIEEMPGMLRWLLESPEGNGELQRIHGNNARLRQSALEWVRGQA
ncbi:hypothetical protein [Novosphingobium sp. FKTRR1]|uniref:hypothetical protein n=1 Tax=Novosphingobium sp. FKTRR1 TaxID=2879118 RepID=UPI001CF03E3A|nr:hypothetical protein [Novosphingobium sp. FKTRR1]